MKKYLILFFIFSFCTQQSSIPIEEEATPPEVFINCNFIDNQNIVDVVIEISVFSNSEKLINGSLKGSGLADNFYKPLDNMNINSSFMGEYIFSSETNGTFSFVVYFDGTKAYRADCNNEIKSITTTTTTTRPATTTTTRPATTTTTRPATTTTTRPATTTTSVPYTNYKTYTLDSLQMFLEVGFRNTGGKEVVWRFEPDVGDNAYFSFKGVEDQGLINFIEDEVRLRLLRVNQGVFNIESTYSDPSIEWQANEIEYWFTRTNFEDPNLFTNKCQANAAWSGYWGWNEDFRYNKIQINICISGNGFGAKKAFIMDSLTTMLGLSSVSSDSKYASYGGYLQPKYVKDKEDWNERDKELLNILYDPRVFIGMSKDEFKEVFELP